MLDDRLKERLARAAEYGAEAARHPDPGAIRHWSRSRRLRRVAVAAVTACVLAGGLVVADINDRPKTAQPARPLGIAPTSFLADRGGRLAVVSTSSGRVVRFLTSAAAGAFSFTLSEDRDTVWFTESDPPCQAASGHSRGLYRVSYQGGAAVKVDGTVNGEMLSISPDESKIAYQPVSRCESPQPSVAIAVLDLRTGTRRTWPAFTSDVDLLRSMAWSTDSRHLAYTEFFGTSGVRTRAWLLDTAGPGTSLAASRPVPAPDRDCEVRDLAWQPGSGLLAIGETCPSGHQLVYVDAPGGRPLSRPFQADQSIDDLDFDPSGDHLLYTTGDPEASRRQRSTWRHDNTRVVEIGKGYGSPEW